MENQEKERMKGITDLVVGENYTHREVVDIFSVQYVGGIRPNKREKYVVVISTQRMGRERNPYEDSWSDGILHYTGTGSKGDQDLENPRNAVLSESNQNGYTIYLLESHNADEYTYKGMARLVGDPYTKIEPDKEGNPRRVYKFPLEIIK